MRISENGLNIIKEFEALKLKPYLCPAKIPTIGYGNTYYENMQKVKLTDPAITEERANELLEFIANRDFSSVVDRCIIAGLNQNQFDALVSFAYNVGGPAFEKSTLARLINTGDIIGASNQFKRWNKSGGKVLNGLIKRRVKEKALFLS